MIKHQKLKYYLLIFFQVIPVYLEAASSCTEWVAKVVSVQGKVETQRSGIVNWKAIQQGDVFCQGDKIRSEKNSRATLQLSNNSLISVDQNTNLNFSVPKVEAASSWLIELFKGSAFFRSRESQRLNINTPFINAVHEGTEFLVTVNSVQTEITVFDGQVAGTNQQGKIHIKKGFTGIAKKGEAPRVKALTIRPEDAVQWTLYYPPIVDYQHLKSDAFKPAIDAYEQGNAYQSLGILEDIQIDQQDGGYLVLKSSLLLTVGRVEEALELIKQARSLNQNESSAIALQSIISVTKNRQDEALKLAQQAVTLNPQSAIAQIALSYAYQSNFKIEPALQATKEATRLSPDNALAWARLSELQLSTGERSKALESAKKAQSLNPQLSRTHTILGFANLAEVDIDEAKNAFNQAIHLNSADPLARLGLGLAKIRKGDVEEGTLDLETAVSLDPDNSIMRSYLGKAYYELKNDGFAGTELTIAKEMDPNDPTPWFYDAIRKQTTNRPVEALHDMQKAIELNDNRGVYRSKLLLDEDLAARSASLGRIYNDLGFQKRGLVEGWKSVNSDPRNYSAHRLLADNYASLPRHEIARVSELLQSQLLQPINITPVQPQFAESNLLILDGLGSQSFSFNEFNPLFARNRLSMQTSGIYGSNDTWGNEIVQSGLWNKFSYSLGQFHYETDGFRENNDLETDIYNVFVQSALTPKLNIQAEYRSRETDKGDLQLRFDPKDIRTNQRQNIEQDTFRVGMRFEPSQKSNFLVSLIYNDRQEDLDRGSISSLSRAKGYQGEAQYLFRQNRFNNIIGGGHYDIDFDNRLLLRGETRENGFKIKHDSAYIYTNIEYPENFILTLGVSYDDFEKEGLKFNKVNPKVGIQWNITDSIQLSSTYFQTVKRTLVANQTIEPTQVSGFNQFFDDANGTETTRYGVALDTSVTNNLHGGIKFSWRDLKVPITNNDTDKVERFDRWEQLYRGYLYWTPYRKWALSIEPQYERFKRTLMDPTSVDDAPIEVETIILPLAVRYFHPKGFFARISGSYVKQNVNLPLESNFARESDDFFLLDATVGYRLPKRRGIIRFEARNLLNKEFLFQDLNSQTATEEIPRFIPDQVLSVQVILNF